MWNAVLQELRAVPLSEEFEQIFREHSGLIYRTAYGVTGSVEDAQDILQTVFLRLLRRELPKQLRDNPKGYLYRAAVNLSLDVIRKRRRRVFVGEEECLTLPAPSAEADADEIHRRLYEAIAQLNPEAANILILRYLHNFSDADIARMLGTSRTAMAVRLLRVRARLRQIMESSLGESK
jgi:RNA polymerase sigma-70 factor (ECF subfamily)